MNIDQPLLSERRTNLVFIALFFGTFVVGCSQVLVIGMLDLIAASLHVSISAAGTLVTASALGLAIGGPILTALTVKLDKRITLITAMSLFAAANLVPVLISSFSPFIAVRGLAGAAQGLFIAVAFVTGTSIVPQASAGRAIAMIIAGVAVAGAIGLPVSSFAGHVLGWRALFAVMIGLSVLTLIAVVALVPSVPLRTNQSVAGQAKHAFAPRVLAILGLCSLAFASLYSAVTYIVPFLHRVTVVTGVTVSVLLFVYGIATAAGSLVGGRFADYNAARTLIIATSGTAVALVALFLIGSIPALVAVVLPLWGLLAFSIVSPIQVRVVSLAGPGAQLAQSLPGSATSIGIASGSFVGGLAISNFGAPAPVVTGLIIAVVSIVVAWGTSFLRPPSSADALPMATVPKKAVEAA